MLKKIKDYIMSRIVSPKGGKRGCICKNGTYSSECCDGELQSQGVGSMVYGASGSVTQQDNTRIITRSNS